MDENELVADLRDQLEAGEGRQEDLQAEVQHLQRQLRDLQAQQATAGVLAKGQMQEGHSEWQRLEDGSEQAQRELQVCYGVCKQRPAGWLLHYWRCSVLHLLVSHLCSKEHSAANAMHASFQQEGICKVAGIVKSYRQIQGARYKVQALMGSSGFTIVHAGSSDSAQAGSG